MGQLDAWASREAVRLLSSRPQRLAHARAVAHRAAGLTQIVGADAELLVAAAWVHDVGYAPELAGTGFHPLDGARHLARLGVCHRLRDLVARHSCSIVEARLRGLDSELAAFPDEGGPVRDALWYCDMTTSPKGEAVTLEQRLSDIQSRYGDGVVSAATEEARPYLEEAIDRTARRLREIGQERQL